jgi:Uma2 family endonuclease
MATNVESTGPIPVPAPLPATNGVPVDLDPMPIIAVDMPVMYEDEGQDEMGESEPHTEADYILTLGIMAHLQSRPDLRVFSNLNVYYHRIDRWAYVSPDVMVVQPFNPLPKKVRSYRIGVIGPPPLLTIEILSQRSSQQQDLSNKPIIYSQLGVAEYILVDSTGEFLEQHLLLRRLQDDGNWADEKDSDGGVTSRLGFRILLEDDGYLRVVEAATGKRYVRPMEAQESLDSASATAEAARADADAARAAAEAEAKARREAEDRAKALEAELARLRGKPSS